VTGPTGATGASGLVGSKGDTGNDGATGATGADGTIGATGATGNDGAIGAAGTQWFSGPTAPGDLGSRLGVLPLTTTYYVQLTGPSSAEIWQNYGDYWAITGAHPTFIDYSIDPCTYLGYTAIGFYYNPATQVLNGYGAGCYYQQSIQVGTKDPNNAQQSGDLYLDTATGELYRYDGTAWVDQVASLIGPTGATGNDGAPGATGATGADGAPGATGATGAVGQASAYNVSGTFNSSYHVVTGTVFVPGNSTGTATFSGAAAFSSSTSFVCSFSLPQASISSRTSTSITVGGASFATTPFFVCSGN
jgi:hypothetical protein